MPDKHTPTRSVSEETPIQDHNRAGCGYDVGDATVEELTLLLLRWQELREQGRDVSAEELCDGPPEMIAELAAPQR